MKKWSALMLALLLVSSPAWAKGNGGSHGQGHSQGEGHGHGMMGSEDHDGPPEGALPPGLAKQNKMPPGLAKKNKTPEGWSHGKKKGWWERIFGQGDDEEDKDKDNDKDNDDASEHPKSTKPEAHHQSN